jgi:hypothetical protein
MQSSIFVVNKALALIDGIMSAMGDVTPTCPVGLAPVGLLLGSGLRCPTMKRIMRRVLLVALVLLELWLLTGFLPERWQEKMYSRMHDIWPSYWYDYSRVTHPNLDYELQPFSQQCAPPAVSLLLSASATTLLCACDISGVTTSP